MATIDDLWEQAFPSQAPPEEDIDSLWMQATNLDKKAPSEEDLKGLDYIANLAKQGFSRGVAGAFETAKSSMGAVQLARLLSGESPVHTPERIQETDKAILEGIGGQQTPRSRDIATNMFEEAVKAPFDPMTYLGAPMKLGGLAARALGGAATGATAELGGEVGGQVEQSIRGEESGVGRLLGSLAGSTAMSATAAQRSAVSQAGGSFWKEYKKASSNPEGYKEAYATGAAKRFLEIVAKEEGIDNLDEVLDNFNAISKKVTGEKAPLIVAMAKNPAVRDKVVELAKTNPDFRAKVNSELSDIAGDIDANANKFFGKRGQEFPKDIDTSLVKTDNIKNRIAILDSRIEKLTDPLEVPATKADTGMAIANLVKAKEKAVRQDMNPKYEEVLSGARNAGAKLPAPATKEIYEFVQDNKLSDIFGKRSPIDLLITKHFSPTTIQKASIPGATGVRTTEGVVRYPEVDFDNVDSLKKRINELQRGRLSPEQGLKLKQLEEVVDTARQTIPGDWNTKLKDLDRMYYKRIGIPFGERGIQDIDGKKYAEQVAPVITKNGSAMAQFLGAVGDEGVPVARNAILSDVYYKFVKDGVLDNKGLTKYLKNNADVIDKVPGVGDELKAMQFDDAALKLHRADLDRNAKVAEKALADNFLTKLDGTPPNYQQMASRVMTDRLYFNKMFNKGGDLSMASPEVSKAVTNSVRREIIELARNSPQGAFNYLSDPTNTFVVNRLFGKGYGQKVKDVAKLSDAIAAADINKVGVSVPTSVLDPLASKFPGADIPYVLSQWRDRIASPAQKVIRIMTRIKTADLKTKTDQEMINLLLDKDGVEKLSRVARDTNFKVENPVNFKKVLSAVTDVLPAYTLVGTQTAMDSMGEQEEPKQIPIGQFSNGL